MVSLRLPACQRQRGNRRHVGCSGFGQQTTACNAQIGAGQIGTSISAGIGIRFIFATPPCNKPKAVRTSSGLERLGALMTIKCRREDGDADDGATEYTEVNRRYRAVGC